MGLGTGWVGFGVWDRVWDEVLNRLGFGIGVWVEVCVDEVLGWHWVQGLGNIISKFLVICNDKFDGNVPSPKYTLPGARILLCAFVWELCSRSWFSAILESYSRYTENSLLASKTCQF